MSYSSTLISEKKVIHSRYFGDITMDDIEAASIQARQFLAASEEPLYLLTNVTDVTSQPNRIVEIWQFAKPVIKHKRLAGWLVAGVNNQIMRFTLKMISKFGNIFYREFDSYEAAIAFLDERVSS